MGDFEPVRTRSVSENVMRQILERIKAGDLRVGDSLPGERVLAKQMQVSRPTISGVMGQLINAGVVKTGSGRNGNAVVASVWIPEELSGMSSGSQHQVDEDEVFRLLEARRAVEPRVAQFAALRATSQDFARMESSISLLEQAEGDTGRALQAELMFHRAMWRAADNPQLERMMVEMESELAPVHDMMLRTSDDFSSGIALHRRTLAALRKGTECEIDQIMNEHLYHFELIVEDVLQRRPRARVPSFLEPPK